MPLNRWAGLACLIAAWPNASAAQSAAEQGREIAAIHCTRCHVVGNINPTGGIGSTPSFQLMVNALADWEARFETFHARRPHPAVIRVAGFEYPDPSVLPPNAAPIEIELEDVDKLIAFARTLKED